jgi:hypothetical protein
VDRTETVLVPCPPERLFGVVDDLRRYPAWLDIVAAAEPGPGPAWDVELRGRLGPLARSKRLRMVRTVHEPPHRVVFERQEHGDRSRAPWVLTATVEPEGEGSRLTVHLHYGGSLWGPVIERLLADEVERARPRLVTLLRE